MAHDNMKDLKQRVSNQSVQIMRLEEKVRSLTKERDHWIAEAAEARALSSRLFEEARSSAAERMFAEPKAENPPQSQLIMIDPHEYQREPWYQRALDWILP